DHHQLYDGRTTRLHGHQESTGLRILRGACAVCRAVRPGTGSMGGTYSYRRRVRPRYGATGATGPHTDLGMERGSAAHGGVRILRVPCAALCPVYSLLLQRGDRKALLGRAWLPHHGTGPARPGHTAAVLWAMDTQK